VAAIEIGVAAAAAVTDSLVIENVITILAMA
jgi:hypothetical protein